jgi:hypothetical protein
MSRYYCHQCAIKLGHIGNPTTEDVLGTTYQMKKFIKHTVPSTKYDLVSIFNDPSTQRYQDYIVEGFASGCYEINDHGRGSITLIAAPSAGARYRSGIFELPENAVRIVLSSNPQRLHTFPVSSTTLPAGFCAECGEPIIT